MNILINDGISAKGGKMLEEAGFRLYTQHVPQNKLVQFMNDKHIEILLVRSRTLVPMEVIDDVPSLKLIGRAGVGLDNIDVDFARELGIHVINTPGASSRAVAELTIAHLFGLARNLQDANRNMPLEGEIAFNDLKRMYANSIELKGKTIGIVGLGRIGKEVAKLAYGIGMQPIAVQYDTQEDEEVLPLVFQDGQHIEFKVPLLDYQEVLQQSDVLSFHIPKTETPLLNEENIKFLKEEVIIINSARGGIIDEKALLQAIDEGKIKSAALDVFEQEPAPSLNVLMHPQLSLSPHIGGSTLEAQERIGVELAEQIINLFGEELLTS